MSKTNKHNEIFKEVLSVIKPNKKRITVVNKFLKNINIELKKKKIKAKAVLGGSYSKGVWLAEDYDVDIFVKFDLKHTKKDISKLLGSALKKFKVERVHGSRDYYQLNGDINYEIIPVLAIKKKEDARNVTDFSPLHVDWVRRHIKGLEDDVRLLKKFLKVQKIYGAESYINGFSGHVSDILIIHYKGFLELLRKAVKWKRKTKQIIDQDNVYKGKVLLMMNKSKIEGPLVLVDPLDPGRNAAAALSEEQFEKFIITAKQFLKKPSISFFEYKKIDFDSLAKKGNLLILDAFALKGKEDVVGSKLVKSYEFILKNLKEFGIVESGWEWNKGKKAEFWYVLDKTELEEYILRKGPAKNQKEFIRSFKKKHKKTFTKREHLYAKVPRKERSIKEILKKALKDKYITSRVKKCLMRS